VRQLSAADYDRKLKESTFQDATEGAPERIEANDFVEARL